MYCLLDVSLGTSSSYLKVTASDMQQFTQFASAPSLPHKYEKFFIVSELWGLRGSVPSKYNCSVCFTSTLVACGKIKQHLHQCVAQKNVRISYFIMLKFSQRVTILCSADEG